MACRFLCRNILWQLNAKRTLHVSYSRFRSLLSSAYSCDDAWQQRLQTPSLQHINVADFAMRLQEKMDREGEALAIDLDILANKLDQLDPVQLDFAENLFQRFRSTARCLDASDSMSYAFVRALLKMGETERLLRILKDKLGYGIFLSEHSASLCMDHLIRHKQYLEASQIAADLMLQEDFGSELCRHLAWYSCHLAWKNEALATLQPEPAQEDGADDEEETLVKVDFIQNPFYDDHWDLPTEGHRLGKTLVLAVLGNTEMMGRSYRLIGLGLWQKFQEGLNLLEAMAESREEKIAKEALEGFQACLEAVHTKEAPTEAKDPGLMRLSDVMPYVTGEQKQEFLNTLQAAETRLASQHQLEECDLGELLMERLNEVTQQQQDSEREKQEALFTKWEKQRQDELQRIIDEIKLHQRKVEIAERLKKLTETEEKLRYFEQEQQVALGISQAPRVRPPVEEMKEEEQFVPPPQERGKMF